MPSEIVKSQQLLCERLLASLATFNAYSIMPRLGLNVWTWPLPKRVLSEHTTLTF